MELLRQYKANVVDFNNKLESFNKVINASPKNKRTIDNRFKCLHEEYLSAVNNFKQLIVGDLLDEESVEIYKSHNQLINVYDEAELAYNLYLDEFEENVSNRTLLKLNEEKLAGLNKQMELSVEKARELISITKLYIETNLSSTVSRGIVKQYKSEIEMILSKIQEYLYDYISIETSADAIASRQSLVTSCVDFYNASRNTIMEYAVNSSVNVNDGTVTESSKSFARLKKLEAPHFDNTRRGFARFKSDFLKLVATELDSTYQAVYLRTQCTSGKAKELIENLESIDAMWDVLGQEFGRPEQLINDVTDRIKKLNTLVDGDTSGLISFVDNLRSGITDLKLIGAESTLCNPMTIREIECRLPEQLAVKWSDIVGKTGNGMHLSNKFVKLMEFLEGERSTASYRLNVMGRNNVMPDTAPINNSETHNARINNVLSVENHKCLYCKSDHLITRRCPIFHKLTLFNKRRVLLDNKACFLCLQAGHISENCTFKTQKKWDPCKYCQNWHASFLCDSSNTEMPGTRINAVSFDNSDIGVANNTLAENVPITNKTIGSSMVNNSDGVLLPVQKLKVDGCRAEAMCLWDSGATGALISNKFADENGLKGYPVSYVLTTVDGSDSVINGKMYSVPLVDKFSNIHVVYALGINKISCSLNLIKVANVVSLFSGITLHDVKRYTGDIDLLVGERYSGIHPITCCIVDNLVLKKSLFGTGWLFSGTHEKLKFSSTHELMPVSTKANYARISELKLISLLSTDSLGVDVPPKCNKCLNCTYCLHLYDTLSKQEQYENDLIYNGLTYDESLQKWVASYPFCQSPHKLIDNRNLCLKIFLSNEKKMSNNFDLMQRYNSQFEDMLNRGVIMQLSDEYIQNWKGAIYYLPHHAVYKESSVSTPMRIVFNSAMKDCNGFSLNDCLMKGQNILNDLINVLIRFRCHKFVAQGDLKKMFHSILTTEVEWNLHRFFFRELGTNDKLKIMAIVRVSFGDRPSPAIAITALRKTVEKFKDIDPMVAKQILEESYMDDCIVGGDDMETLNQRTKAAELMLGKGGFQFKDWSMVGDQSTSVIAAVDNNKLLGVHWNKSEDTLYFNVNINFSYKIAGKCVEEALTLCNFEEKFPKILSRRKCLSIANSLFDPLGLVQPIIIKLKLALREIIVHGKNQGTPNDWDAAIPDFLYIVWVDLVKELFLLETLSFVRRLIPLRKDPNEKPFIVTFSDGSCEALMAVSYICVKLVDGTMWTNLIMSKTKLAPMSKLTIPRVELLAAVMNVRLTDKIIKAVNFEIGQSVHIIDSKIVLSMIHSVSVCYGEFMGTRISEIQRKSDVKNWYRVESKQNIADIGTKGNTKVNELQAGSIWQTGPLWLRNVFSKWPLMQDIESSNEILPELKKQYEYHVNSNSYSSIVVGGECDIVKLFDCKKYSSYNRLLRVTAYVLRFIKCLKDKTTHLLLIPLNAVDLANAEKLWMADINNWSLAAFQKGQYKSLCPKIVDGFLVITGRAGQRIHNYNPVNLPLLDVNHPVTHLYVRHIHEIRHSGVDQTVAFIRMKYWIPRCRKVSKYYKRKCLLCRKLDNVLCKQVMSKLPESRIKPSPIWWHTALDLFGPLEIKDSVRKRVTGKAWGIIFSCHASRAVFITTTEDYSTDSFLQALNRFINRNGCPMFLYSDRGSQILGATNELKEYVSQLDNTKLSNYAANLGMTWTFSPTQAPWYMGTVERMIRIVKRLLVIIVGKQNLTFGELETTLSQIEFLINSRPLFRYPDNDPLDRVGCPLDLMMGRNDKKPPVGMFNLNSHLTKRCLFLQKLVRDFWDKWSIQAFHYLAPYTKWRTEYRDVAVGDIVHIHDNESNIVGNYKLGVVDSVHLDADGHVRRVVVKYKLLSDTTNNSNCYKYTERAIQSLVVIIPVEELKTDSDDTFDMDVSQITTTIARSKPKVSKILNKDVATAKSTFSGRSVKAPDRFQSVM